VEQAISKAKKVISKTKNKSKLHQRLANLETRLSALIAQKESEDPRICFGSRKLFRKQFNLEINGYRNHDEWLADWRAKRDSQFYVLGSKDETAGCQGCIATENPDGTFDLRLRLTGSLSEYGKYLHLRGIRFGYGADELSQALKSEQALSYRFIRDEKGWRVMVTTDLPEIKTVSIRQAGAVGVDINENCLAVTEIDRFGNMVATRVIPLVTYGKSSDQAKAIIGDAVKDLVTQAVEARKPIIIEKLDFRKKKAQLEGEHPGRSRMLSSLGYNKIMQCIHSAGYRSGIEVIEVNPAYTSTIGAVNFSKINGISIHQGAALAIARRGAGFRERPTTEEACLPTPRGDHVTFPLPVRNRGEHVCSFWSGVKNIQKAVLAAHLRPPQGEPLRPERPLKSRVVKPALSKVPRFTVRPRDASRRQNCSANAMDDIPWCGNICLYFRNGMAATNMVNVRMV